MALFMAGTRYKKRNATPTSWQRKTAEESRRQKQTLTRAEGGGREASGKGVLDEGIGLGGGHTLRLLHLSQQLLIFLSQPTLYSVETETSWPLFPTRCLQYYPQANT